VPQTLLDDLDAALADVEALLARSTTASQHPVLAAAARKMVEGGGKRMRPRILLLSYRACGGKPKPEVLEAAAGMELIHTATLVHDDIIDRGELRRGQPATHREYGLERAIVAGDFLFIQGFALSALQDAEVVRLTARACTRLAEGELLEIDAAFRPDLDLDRYLDIIERKTAAPLDACGRVGAHLAGRDDLQDALGAYGKHLGMAFQVTDDLLDLRGDPALTGKPRGTDLRSGAPNGVVLLGLQNGARGRLGAILGRRVRTEADVQAAIEALLDSGAVEEAERLAEHHARLAEEALAPLPDSDAKRALVQQVRGLRSRAR
jgi:geranylgeranyl pyrophosphate synthase